MSLPSYPDKSSLPSREEAINQIISSIAMEELGLSHIINAEGEKIQYALGTISGISGPAEPASIQDLLSLNESVQRTLDSAMMNQFYLKEKMTNALSASVLTGPTGATGPTGPQGPVSIEINPNTDNLEPGEPASVENEGTDERVILKFGIPRGYTGATGSAEVSAMQVILNNAGGELEIPQNAVIPFNSVLSSNGTDITYDMDTRTFTINAAGINDIYLINWWVFAGGSNSTAPITFSLNAGAIPYPVTTPWVETQLSGSALIIAGGNPIQVTLTNAGNSAVTLSDINIQAQINIIGFKNAN